MDVIVHKLSQIETVLNEIHDKEILIDAYINKLTALVVEDPQISYMLDQARVYNQQTKTFAFSVSSNIRQLLLEPTSPSEQRSSTSLGAKFDNLYKIFPNILKKPGQSDRPPSLVNFSKEDSLIYTTPKLVPDPVSFLFPSDKSCYYPYNLIKSKDNWGEEMPDGTQSCGRQQKILEETLLNGDEYLNSASVSYLKKYRRKLVKFLREEEERELVRWVRYQVSDETRTVTFRDLRKKAESLCEDKELRAPREWYKNLIQKNGLQVLID